MAGVINKIQHIEQVAYASRQSSVMSSVLSFVSQALFQSLAMVTGTAIAKALFTRLLPFNHDVFSREGFETRRALVLLGFMTILVMVFRFLYPQGLPVALGGLVQPPSSPDAPPPASGVARAPPRAVLNPCGDRPMARDDLPTTSGPASGPFHPF